MSNYQFDRQRWAQMTIYEQLGNIGSEVGRAIAAKRSGRTTRMESAIDRALDLFSATVEVNLTKSQTRTREVLRARDEFLRLFYDDTFEGDADNIENYYMNFVVLARNSKADTGERHRIQPQECK